MNVFKFVFLLFCVVAAPLTGYADRIVAIVDDQVITQGDLGQALLMLRYQGRRNINDSTKEKVLEHMIENKLLYSEAIRQGIKPDSDKVKQAIANIKGRFDSEREFKESLEKGGLSVKSLYDRFKEQSMVKELVDKEISSKIFVSPVELADYYKEHEDEFCVVKRIKVNSILIPSDNQDISSLGQIAKQSVFDLRNGNITWKDLQSRYGEGIIEGWVSKEDVSPQLYVLFSPNVEVYPEPIKLKSGFYLFRISDIDQNCPKNFEEARDRVYSLLYKKKFEERFKEYVSELKRKSYVKVFPLR